MVDISLASSFELGGISSDMMVWTGSCGMNVNRLLSRYVLWMDRE